MRIRNSRSLLGSYSVEKGKRLWLQYNTISWRHHTLQVSAFTVSTALAALPCPSQSSLQGKLLFILQDLAQSCVSLESLPGPSLTAHCSLLCVPTALYIHVYSVVIAFTGNFFVSPTISLRTRIYYLIHLCTPKTQSAWHFASDCCVIKEQQESAFALHLHKSNWFLVLLMGDHVFS